jgi:hypothetical protein
MQLGRVSHPYNWFARAADDLPCCGKVLLVGICVIISTQVLKSVSGQALWQKPGFPTNEGLVRHLLDVSASRKRLFSSCMGFVKKLNHDD